MPARDWLAARLATLKRSADDLDAQLRVVGEKRVMVEGAIRELTEAINELDTPEAAEAVPSPEASDG